MTTTKRHGRRQSTLLPPDQWHEYPRTAEEARARGTGFCFTGLPCGRGHLAPQYASNSTCVECHKIHAADSADRRKEREKAQREVERQQAWRTISSTDCPWPATRDEAERIGAEFYFTGKECETRHTAVRRAADHSCIECPSPADCHRQRMVEEGTEVVLAEQAAYSKARYWSDPDKQRKRIADRRARGLVSSIYADELSIHDLRRPPWQTDEEKAAIEEFYANCPADCTVDHDVPFVHPVLAGLHVRANLLYAGPHRNARKGNRVSYTQEEAEAEVARGRAVWRDETDGGHVLAWEKYRGVHPVFPQVNRRGPLCP